MTDRPTDAELDALCIEISDYDDAAYFRHMARTVLARFGTPPPAVAREQDTALIAALEKALDEATEWMPIGSGTDPRASGIFTALEAARTRLGIQTGEKT